MALGFALMGWSIGPAFGPFMGEFAGVRFWRVVYGITLPLCGLGFILAWWWFPYLQRPERRRLDYYGALAITVVVSTLLLALSQGNREGWDSQYILTFAIAGVAAVSWVVVELCHPQPLVELRLFSSVPFVMAMIVMFLTTMTFRGTGPMVSVLLQRLMGLGAHAGGLRADGPQPGVWCGGAHCRAPLRPCAGLCAGAVWARRVCGRVLGMPGSAR